MRAVYVPARHWQKTGAGASSVGTSWHLMRSPNNQGNRPARIPVTNRRASRLEEMRHLHAGFGSEVPVEYLQIRGKPFDPMCEIAATAGKPLLGGD